MDKLAVLEKLEPGTELIVGSHKVTVIQFISEGGFAHIYKVRVSASEHNSDIACLKRVIVPDKDGLHQLRSEVDVMKRLSGCSQVVRYYDSHASHLPGSAQSYEVLVLMELCENKSLLDYMNSHLETKLTEPKILKIMLDICLGVLYMHQLKLIHRDIKIENVLIDSKYNFKLCDFGSTCPVLRAPKTFQEFHYLSHDILRQTTPQYRSPEMVDLYKGLPINEKSDIWALGIFLYKLCYYTTPFEKTGELAILHSAYQFPHESRYSSKLKRLIVIMLQEDPALRPNSYQLTSLVIQLLGTYSDIKLDRVFDFYQEGEYDFKKLLENLQPPISHPLKEIYEAQLAFLQEDVARINVQEEVSKSVVNLTNQQHLLKADNLEKSITGLSVSSVEVDLDKVEERFPHLDLTTKTSEADGSVDLSSSETTPAPVQDEKANKYMVYQEKISSNAPLTPAEANEFLALNTYMEKVALQNYETKIKPLQLTMEQLNEYKRLEAKKDLTPAELKILSVHLSRLSQQDELFKQLQYQQMVGQKLTQQVHQSLITPPVAVASNAPTGTATFPTRPLKQEVIPLSSGATGTSSFTHVADGSLIDLEDGMEEYSDNQKSTTASMKPYSFSAEDLRTKDLALDDTGETGLKEG
ncbi:hypothetical protein LJB42_003970 [Komagataella kurtzmanii]|nr:hypothetical protein LJB42_003970 [Komagataella kurtzmanii]